MKEAIENFVAILPPSVALSISFNVHLVHNVSPTQFYAPAIFMSPEDRAVAIESGAIWTVGATMEEQGIVMCGAGSTLLLAMERLLLELPSLSEMH